MANRIDRTFAILKKGHRKALIGYITAGFPKRSSFRPLVSKLTDAGIDLLEIGVPFSDPIADGPTIQHASQVALQQRVELPWILSEIRALRQSGLQTPLILMSYCNPIQAIGIPQFFTAARHAGVDGLIIPDIIPEESDRFARAARANRIHMIYLVAPTTPKARIPKIAANTRGFLYAVSLTGVTGARSALPKNVAGFLQSVRRVSKSPVAVGFGVSTPDQVRQMSHYADGVIVGSALIQHIQKSKAPEYQRAVNYVRSLKGALHAA